LARTPPNGGVGLAFRSANTGSLIGIIRLVGGCLRVGALLGVAVLLSASSTRVGTAAPSRAPIVVVIKKGLISTPGSGYAQYGLILRNRSATRDALHVGVHVTGTDSRGRAVTSDELTITLIPAGKDFVVTGALVWQVSLDIVRLTTSVRVHRTALRGRRLPPVKGARLTNDPFGDSNFTGWLVNPYKKRLPPGATVYGVFLDKSGRIIATDSIITNAAVRRGAAVPFELDGMLDYVTSDGANPIVAARTSVDPCGEFEAGCPVLGVASR
jgi:hypothetical protein